MSMTNLDDLKIERTKAAEEAAAREQAEQEFRQTLTAAATGEHLPEDFEVVEADAERTFTQDEVNNIVRSRLAKERARYAEAAAAMAKKLAEYENTLTEREQQLKAAEIVFEAKRMLPEMGLNTDEATLNLVIGADLEETRKKIQDLAFMAAPQGQRPMNDRNVVRTVMGLHT